MFDYHMHSSVSFDADEPAAAMVAVAEKAGLLEICFTDHYDYNDLQPDQLDAYTLDRYKAAYEPLKSDRVKIRRGVEFGLTHWNMPNFRQVTAAYDYDFVMGSVHYAGGSDPYFPEFWAGISPEAAFEKYLLQALKCVKLHEGFDVLGHLNYACKSVNNPTKKPLYYKVFPDICDEIMKTLVEKGIGMEINTSGVDRVGDFLPSIDFIKRFRELGGEIVTVGSDAHGSSRVGQHIDGALAIAKEVFGYVCTFENRKPIFHKL